jgi:hypothetical protein
MSNFGGTKGATWFSCFDVDPDTNFIAGGGTMDTDLCISPSASPPDPILVKLDSNGVYVWAKTFTMTTHSSIHTVAFDKQDYSRFVAIFDQGSGVAEVLTIAILNSKDASAFNLYQAYQDASGNKGGLFWSKSTSFIGGNIFVVGSDG